MHLRRTCSLLLLAAPLLAQVTARQGTPSDLQQSEFASPMVLELPLDKLGTPELGDVYSFTEQDKFVCDDVSLPIILIRKSVNRSKQVVLSIKTTAYVRPSYDRKVTIDYSILRDGVTLGAHSVQEISAKEKENRTDSSTLVLSGEAFESLFKDGSHGRLKLVVVVTPDR